MSAPLKGKWAHHYKKCVVCGEKKFKHKGRGLCTSCFDRMRARTKKRQEQLKKAQNKYWEKNKKDGEYKKKNKETAIKYRNGKTYKNYLNKICLRNRVRRFLGREVIYKRDKGNLKMRCPKCDKLVLTTIKPQKEIPSVEIETFKKEVVKHCNNHLKI